MKYTEDGVFRKFAFIGFQSDDEANAAVRHFDKTCVNTSRVSVEICASLGAENKPKSWSKHSSDSSAYKKLHGMKDDQKKSENVNDSKENEKTSRKKTKDARLNEIYGEHKNDPKFIEFMKVHSKCTDLWNNDLELTNDVSESDAAATTSKVKTKLSDKIKCSVLVADNDDDDEVDADENYGGEYGDVGDNEDGSKKLANQKISDTDYLKKLINKKDSESATKVKKSTKGHTEKVDLFTIKIREIPFSTKRKDVIAFFKPARPYSVRLPTRSHGFCYVGFKTEKEFTKAWLKDRSFLKGKQVHFTDFTEKNKESKQINDGIGTGKTSGKVKNPIWAKQEEALKDEEDISESGRIFFRNLAYTVTEDQVQEHFEKFGPIAEISLPIDVNTRKIKGFGIVTFVMPEHALKAFADLDGTIFHGRLLHLIPGKGRVTDDKDPEVEGLSFKEKKKLKQKHSAGLSHNWNTLFLGANAVADLLAKNYNITKEQILDTSGGGSSAAVRLALGETELVIEMRNFLENNDVLLDAFNQISMKRSKTVILAKNLPADTTIADIQPLFAKFGILGRVILPPSGVTAIIEYLEPSEARIAFKKLAYTKFKNLPLYLEWAPENTFKFPSTTPMTSLAAQTRVPPEQVSNEHETPKKKSNAFSKQNSSYLNKNHLEPLEYEHIVLNEPEHMVGDKTNSQDTEELNNTDPEPETTLFLRNLNFDTREDAVRNHFNHIGHIHDVQVAMKKDPENPKNHISLGYGFIQFKLKVSTEKALKTMQFTSIEGNSVELRRSDRTLQ